MTRVICRWDLKILCLYKAVKVKVNQIITFCTATNLPPIAVLSAYRHAANMTEVSETFSPGQDAGNQFERLVQGIEAHFQTSEPQNASLDGKSDGDVEYLMHLMNTYTSDSADWEQYAYSDPSRNYTRNRVADLGGKANLVCLMISEEPSRAGLLSIHCDIS